MTNHPRRRRRDIPVKTPDGKRVGTVVEHSVGVTGEIFLSMEIDSEFAKLLGADDVRYLSIEE